MRGRPGVRVPRAVLRLTVEHRLPPSGSVTSDPPLIHFMCNCRSTVCPLPQPRPPTHNQGRNQPRTARSVCRGHAWCSGNGCQVGG